MMWFKYRKTNESLRGKFANSETVMQWNRHWYQPQHEETPKIMSLRDCASTYSAADVDLSNCSRLAHRVCKGQDVIKRLNFILWHLEVRLKQAQQQNLTIHAELGWCLYRMGIFCKVWGVNAQLRHFCVLLTTQNSEYLYTDSTSCMSLGREYLFVQTMVDSGSFKGKLFEDSNYFLHFCWMMHVSFTVILFRATIPPFYMH